MLINSFSLKRITPDLKRNLPQLLQIVKCLIMAQLLAVSVTFENQQPSLSAFSIPSQYQNNLNNNYIVNPYMRVDCHLHESSLVLQ